MQPDTELETWRRQWQAHDVVPPDLRQRVEREIRSERAGRVAAIAVTVAFGLAVPWWAIQSRRMDVVVLAIAVWAFIAVCWAVTWNIGRGPARPASATTTAFLDFAVLSCERRHRTISAATVLYVAMLMFNLAWVYQAQPEPSSVAAFLVSRRLVAVYVITAVLGALAIWSRRKVSRELHNLADLRRQLEG